MSKVWKWTVVIVGLSSGIGAGFAREFAEQGYNLLLISKNKAQLETFVQYLQVLYPIAISTNVLDIHTATGRKKTLDILKDIKDLFLLINCIGHTTEKTLSTKHINKLKQTITKEDTSSMIFSYEALKIIETKKQWSIIHVSSLVSLLGIGKDPIVAMSRIFLDSPIGNLERIKKNSAISLQLLCPNSVDINFWYFQQPSKYRSKTIQHIIKKSLSDLQQWKLVCIPLRQTQLILTLYHILPRSRSYSIFKRLAR